MVLKNEALSLPPGHWSAGDYGRAPSGIIAERHIRAGKAIRPSPGQTIEFARVFAPNLVAELRLALQSLLGAQVVAEQPGRAKAQLVTRNRPERLARFIREGHHQALVVVIKWLDGRTLHQG